MKRGIIINLSSIVLTIFLILSFVSVTWAVELWQELETLKEKSEDSSLSDEAIRKMKNDQEALKKLAPDDELKASEEDFIADAMGEENEQNRVFLGNTGGTDGGIYDGLPGGAGAEPGPESKSQQIQEKKQPQQQ